MENETFINAYTRALIAVRNMAQVSRNPMFELAVGSETHVQVVEKVNIITKAAEELIALVLPILKRN
jgi:hypothetical protein